MCSLVPEGHWTPGQFLASNLLNFGRTLLRLFFLHIPQELNKKSGGVFFGFGTLNTLRRLSNAISNNLATPEWPNFLAIWNAFNCEHVATDDKYSSFVTDPFFHSCFKNVMRTQIYVESRRAQRPKHFSTFINIFLMFDVLKGSKALAISIRKLHV